MSDTEQNSGSFVREIPDGDDRERLVCPDCGFINYENPKIVVGAVVTWEDRILLCRRAIPPRRGFWTLPAGFMEVNETAAEGAAREAMEEANAELVVKTLYAVFSVPHISQVYAIFIADLLAPSYSPGSESLEVGLFAREHIPWDELAFPVMVKTLELYFSDRDRGQFGSYAGDILRGEGTTFTPIFNMHGDE